jgi:hypothetical protein
MTIKNVYEKIDDIQDIHFYKNRKVFSLPKEVLFMDIIKNDNDGFHIFTCSWNPYFEENYTEENRPSESYLGTASVITGQYKRIGFHVWEQNNSEFIYYRIREDLV